MEEKRKKDSAFAVTKQIGRRLSPRIQERLYNTQAIGRALLAQTTCSMRCTLAHRSRCPRSGGNPARSHQTRGIP